LRIAVAGTGFKPLPATADWRRLYVTQGGQGLTIQRRDLADGYHQD
jgi:hypothetical protein